MRSRAANVLNSTWPASTAVSSSSSKAKSGTFFNISGLHAIDASLDYRLIPFARGRLRPRAVIPSEVPRFFLPVLREARGAVEESLFDVTLPAGSGRGAFRISVSDAENWRRDEGQRSVARFAVAVSP